MRSSFVECIFSNHDVEIPDVVLPTADELAEAKQSLQQLLKTILTSSELRGVLTDSIQLLRDFFADQAESIANVSITATRASKKAARAARVTEEEKRKGKTGLEGVDLAAIDPKDVKKQVVRKVEDVKDDALKVLEKKRRLVRSRSFFVFALLTIFRRRSSMSRKDSLPMLRTPSWSDSRRLVGRSSTCGFD